MARYLHATDFSPASGAAFAMAVAWARHTLLRSQRAAAQKRLDALVAKARRVRVRARGLLAEGVAADSIVRTARGRRANLIVVGTHGRRGAARFFLGSVAGGVVAAAHCPVLTVRGR